jgi:hypothetical protein
MSIQGIVVICKRTLLLAAALLALALLCAPGASAGPRSTLIARAAGTIVPIPASIPHEEGDMVDRRIVPDLRWIAQHFPIYVTDGYSGPLPGGAHAGCHGCHVRHSDHYNGLAVDIVPVNWSPRCDRNWRGITRLARWAEPRQNRPLPPFRWVGYNGDAGHGCGNHLHLSWEHAPAPQYQLAEWVEVFPVRAQSVAAEPSPLADRAPRQSSAPPPGVKPPPTPPGGLSPAQPGGLSAAGD